MAAPGPQGLQGPAGPPPAGQPGSGAALQDPTGFPIFHTWPAPPGPAPGPPDAWSPAQRLSGRPGGGYRPQIAAAPDGTLHIVYYSRLEAGDLIRHRMKRPGGSWSDEAPLGLAEGRNWGPDLIVRDDGSAVVVFDHARPDFSSQGFVTTFAGGSWSTPEALTPDDPQGEIGSGHVADTAAGDLAYVWIGKKMDPKHRFRAFARWRRGGSWTEVQALSDGRLDAWHSNIERRPDGSALVGWDEGVGGAETTLYVAEARDGRVSAREDLSQAPGKPGERAHFGFGPDGRDHVAWFHKEQGRPLHIYVRSGRPGAWEPEVQAPADGLGGYHFDPDIAVNHDGVRVIVWGWDAGTEAELLYSIDRGQGWSPAHRVARIDWGKPGLPSLVSDSMGAFHVVWNQGERGDNHVYMATLSP